MAVTGTRPGAQWEGAAGGRTVEAMTEPPEERPAPAETPPTPAPGETTAPLGAPAAAPPGAAGSGSRGVRGWVSTPGRAALAAVVATLVLAIVPCTVAAFVAGAVVGSVSTRGHVHEHWDKPRDGRFDQPYPGPFKPGHRQPMKPAPTKPAPATPSPSPTA